MVAVEVPASEKEEKTDTKKGRGRPKGSTKKKTTPPKAKQGDSTQLKILLVTVSGILSSRPNMSAFQLTMEEAEQIAQPLSNILAKNEGVNAITSEYADHIALVVACLTIFVPKYFMYQATKPKEEKKKNVQPFRKSERPAQPQPEAGQTTGSHRPANGDNGTTHDVETFNGGLSNLLAPIAGL
jgi:hypothetical protein